MRCLGLFPHGKGSPSQMQAFVYSLFLDPVCKSGRPPLMAGSKEPTLQNVARLGEVFRARQCQVLINVAGDEVPVYADVLTIGLQDSFSDGPIHLIDKLAQSVSEDLVVARFPK